MLDAAPLETTVGAAQIGPNAILQLAAPVDCALGPGAMSRLLAQAHAVMPSGDHMIDEAEVARVHQALRKRYPNEAPGIARAAGIGTARYIRANRIPAPARVLLRLLPSWMGERVLSKAIAAHAWTFCGSGKLHVEIGRTIGFEIADNPVLAGFHAQTPQCDWHCAVFEELFTSLLGRPYQAHETACCAMGAPACRFEVSRH